MSSFAISSRLRVEELADAEEQLGALRERHRAPGRERLLRALHRRVDLLDRREIDRPALHAGRRVEDRPAATRRPVDARAADPVGDPRDRPVALDCGGLGKLRHRPSSSKSVLEGIAGARLPIGPRDRFLSGQACRFRADRSTGPPAPLVPRERRSSAAVPLVGIASRTWRPGHLTASGT